LQLFYQAEKKTRDIQQGKALGRIASSCAIEYDATNWTMRSVIPWAGVHNEGGRVGHGAVVAKRTFLEWTTERVDKFAELSLDYLVGKAAKRSQSA
jgi:phage gpG-like protein